MVKSTNDLKSIYNLPYYHIRLILQKNNIKLRSISESLKGIIFSEEHKQHISENHWDNSGENNPNYGKSFYGELNPRWKGGKKLSQMRKDSKRKQFGYFYLNKPFEDSEGHHIDINTVIFIPKEVHKMITHNVKTCKNMEIINTYAYFFLVQNNIKELSGVI